MSSSELLAGTSFAPSAATITSTGATARISSTRALALTASRPVAETTASTAAGAATGCSGKRAQTSSWEVPGATSCEGWPVPTRSTLEIGSETRSPVGPAATGRVEIRSTEPRGSSGRSRSPRPLAGAAAQTGAGVALRSGAAPVEPTLRRAATPGLDCASGGADTAEELEQEERDGVARDDDHPRPHGPDSRSATLSAAGRIRLEAQDAALSRR